MWQWIASLGQFYDCDVLQYTKQAFSLRLPQMTKYCVMGECDNIHQQPLELMPFPHAFAWLNALRTVKHSHKVPPPPIFVSVA
jgi:hypothetical protein